MSKINRESGKFFLFVAAVLFVAVLATYEHSPLKQTSQKQASTETYVRRVITDPDEYYEWTKRISNIFSAEYVSRSSNIDCATFNQEEQDSLTFGMVRFAERVRVAHPDLIGTIVMLPRPDMQNYQIDLVISHPNDKFPNLNLSFGNMCNVAVPKPPETSRTPLFI